MTHSLHDWIHEIAAILCTELIIIFPLIELCDFDLS